MTRGWIGWCLFIPGIALSFWYYSPSLHVHRHLVHGWLWIHAVGVRMRTRLRTMVHSLWHRLRSAVNRLRGRPTLVCGTGEITMSSVAATLGVGYAIHGSDQEAIEALYAAVGKLKDDTELWQARHLDEHEHERRHSEGRQHRSAWIGLAGLALVTAATVVWNLPR